MKITFLTPHSLRYYGGGEKWIISVANLLVQRGHEVEVVALAYSPSGTYRTDDRFIKEICNFSYSEISYRNGKFTPIRIKPPIRIKSDIIYVTGGYYYFLSQALHFESKKIYGFHDPALQNPKNMLQRRIITSLLPRFDMVHTLNDFQTRMLQSRGRVFQLSNTYFGEQPSCGQKFEKFTVLFFGQHEIIKGIDIVKNIMIHLPPDIEMIIAGSGSVDIGKSIKENIKIVGFASEDELSSLLCRSHAVLFPSRSEASSLVAIESIAHGTPLIYRNIPENSVLVDKPLCISSDSDDGFLEKILRLKEMYVNNPKEYIRICNTLPKTLMNPEEYISRFEQMLRMANSA